MTAPRRIIATDRQDLYPVPFVFGTRNAFPRYYLAVQPDAQ